MEQPRSPELAPHTAPAALFVGRPSTVRYGVLAAACLLALIAYVHRVGFAFVGAYLKQDLHLNDQHWSVVMAVFLVAYALFEVPWGRLGDRFGARHLLTVAALVWSLLSAAVAFVALLPAATIWPFVLLLVLRVLFGIFQAGLFPALARVLTDWMPTRERGTAQGFVWTFSRLGGAAAPFLMGGLILWLGSWAAALVLTALLGIGWCAVFWPWFRDRPEQMPAVNAAERSLIAAGRMPHQAGGEHLPWSQLLRSRSVWALCLMYGFGSSSATFFITLLPSYLREHRKLSDTQMQFLSGLPLAAGVIACLAGGMLSDWIIRRTGDRKWGRRVVGMVGHVGAGAALLATNWVHDPRALAALLTATFFCNDLTVGSAWAACADIGERAAGTLGGAMNMCGNLAAAVVALLAGYLFGKEFSLHVGGTTYVVIGNELVFVIFACAFWLAALCWLGVDVTRPLALTGTAPPREAKTESGFGEK